MDSSPANIVVSKKNCEDKILSNDEDEELDDASNSERQQHRHQLMHNREHPTNGAEHLVRSEARAVRLLRAVVIGLLVTATMLTGVFTYRLAIKNQIDTFNRDFEALAERFVTQFETGIRSYLYQSNTLSNAISSGLFVGVKPNFPEVTLSDLDNLATGLRFQARALDVIWSPLLKTKAERDKWETYAKLEGRNASSSSLGQNPICYVCGEGNEVLNPNNQIVAVGLGMFTCQVTEQGALSGFFSPSECAGAKLAFPSACGCKPSNTTKANENSMSWNVNDGIFRIDNNQTAVRDQGPAPFSPVWQFSPHAAGEGAIMFNQMSDPRRRRAINAMIKHNIPVFSNSFEPAADDFYNLLRTPAATNGIVGMLFFPVYESSQSNVIAGSLTIDFSWKIVFELGLTSQSEGIVIVLENSCGQAFTFQVVGNQAEFMGEGDLHDTAFDALMVQSSLSDFLQLVSSISPRGGFQVLSPDWGCAYTVRLFPSEAMRSQYLTGRPWVEAVVVVCIFVFTSLVFLLYDFILRRLQRKVMGSAKRSEAMLSSLFPAVVRDRLYGDQRENQNIESQRRQAHRGHLLFNHKIRLKTFLSHPTSEDVIRESDPIADLFPSTTIMFADIAGFTAWSSEREPAQVFKLLETIYGAFDQVANRRGVFKIETIGDCYVAVTGLPEPCEDHAVVMVKFAFDCLIKMGELTKRLESALGPGTADLAIRVGLHSGPVTGGVLRGERARFQLFGDTMNTASRMESNGKVNHIHVTKETAELLIKAGKSDWVEQRSEMISVKGKGAMQTYWVKPSKPKQRKASFSESTSDGRSSSGHNVEGLWGTNNVEESISSPLSRRDRLVAWNADLLEQFLQKIVAKRKAVTRSRSVRQMQNFKFDSRKQLEDGGGVIDQIAEIIRMPDYSEQTAKDEMDPTSIDIGAKVRAQLREYVADVAALYHDNAFHNFEHASHVVMSASKLLKRIITPDDVDYRAHDAGQTIKSHAMLSKEIHDSTYGISSDPLMQFAIVFSALIHDVDHTGLQNKQLVQRNDPLAMSYLGKCVAEQHSIQCAWRLLMDDRFVDLRRCIYQTDDNRLRFRQLVINAVIATDIADKELQAWRQSRWDKAFHQQGDESTMDRKATLLFEYILQASDVAPTMQHWHVYQKWNQRLFEERYVAFVLGNDQEDPSVSWYEAELSFFDNYVIPLARTLEESNVFGVSCDDSLAYAQENRREWEIKGKQIVIDMVASMKSSIAELGPEHPLHDDLLLKERG